MKLSRASTYALHALANLANRERSDFVGAREMALAYGISEHLLCMALKSLVEQQMLELRPGPEGGYRLARPVSEITVLEVVEAVDGPIRGVVPVEESDSNPEVSQRLQTLCNRVAKATRQQLQTVTVAELVGCKSGKQ